MMYRNVFDSHVHSDNSFDAHHSVMFLCETAIEKGLAGLCITDHCEMREYVQEEYTRCVEQSVFDAEKAACVFNGRLSVMAGIELSDIFYDEALTESVLASHHFDFVLASQHNASNGEDIYYTHFQEWSSDEIHQYLTFYFEYLARIAKWNQYDVLAHLTYPLRYITGNCSIPIDLKKYADIIEDTLKTVAQNGKGIEINTSSLDDGIKDFCPPFSIIRRFRELGGEYITIGSDAHAAENIGRGIEKAMETMVSNGFTHVTFYKQRHPLLFAIESIG